MTFLLDCALRAAVIMAIALAATSVLRRSSAATRHSVLAAAMLCVAVLPVLLVVTPEWTLEAPAGFEEFVPIPPRASPAATEGKWGLAPFTRRDLPESSESCCAVGVRPVRPHFSPPGSGIAAAWAESAPSHLQPLIWVWAGGAVITLVVLLIGWIRLSRIAQKSAPVFDVTWIRCAGQVSREYGFRRGIRLLQSRHPTLLATWGVFRPKIVLPSNSVDWHENRIQVVLRHELAHVRRNDWFIQILSELLRAAYWFNPLIWIACARLRRFSEQAADDMVLNAGVAGSDYAAHLLDLARIFRKPRRAWSLALLMAHGSTLEQRFKALLNPDINRRALTRLSVMTAAFAFLALSLPIAALRVTAQELLSLELPLAVPSVPRAAVTQAVLPVSTPTASLEGVVVRMNTGEPLSEVHVELNPSERRGNGRVTTTGLHGQFAFNNVPPGDYHLVAARDGGFLPAAYGQRSLTGRGLTITLTPGQKMTRVQLAMAQPGSISGRVMDRAGEPAVRAQVQALRTVYMDGRRSESVIASVATDDRGEYRLYWLPPGQYRVSATPQDIRRGWVPVIPKTLDSPVTFYTIFTLPVVTRRLLENGEIQEEVQVSTYFPGTPDVEEASVIELAAGADVTAVDITVFPPVRTHRIRGVLINATNGQPVSGGSLRLLSLTNEGALMMSKADGSGRFEISGVLPGPYVLSATTEFDDTRNELAGSLPVTVSGNDLENVAIALSAGVDIPVRVTVEGRPAGGGVTLRLNTVPRTSMFGGMPAIRPGNPQHNLLTTSAFMLEGVQYGEYTLSFFPMSGGGPSGPMPAYVKSIRMGPADVLNGLLRVDGPVQHPLEIVLSTNTGTLEGTVVNNKQEPAANVSVALIPDAPYRARTDLYKAATTDASGRFQISGIAPGTYRAFSWEDVEGWAWQDPEWLRPYEGRGRPVHFGEGGKEKTQLTVIR